ncbi:hypothetical protein MKW98_028965 [Papaver atlanticum]|uniref:Late embryogenesis abundant protein LEA-2 subgroup domain-containing protein n=1 Tax=Papaver atlanticum TaxID=357466 RepID=A0AAD4TLB3_9MAGN|nr:hypothetical protein MKW98_028965 [Papaver atlanticum]
MKFHVNDASLAKFYLTNDDILHYSLSINISVRNSNKIERISYQGIRSEIFCYGKDLALVPLPSSFRQGTKNTTLLYLVFQGQALFKLRGCHLKDFNIDQRDESYSIYVYLYLTTQSKHTGGGKSGKSDFIVKCGLFRVHLLGSFSSLDNQTGNGGLFKTRRCKLYADRDDDDYNHY